MVLSVLLGISAGVCLGLLGVGVQELLLGNLAQSAEALVVSFSAGLVGYLIYKLEEKRTFLLK